MPQTSKDKIDQEKIKINEVGKTFFEIQFDAKEKIITRLKIIYLVVSRILKSVSCEITLITYHRLNDEIKDFNSKNEKFKGKINRLNKKLKDDYEYLKKILDEKTNLEKQLKEEIAQLKQVWTTYFDSLKFECF